MSKNPHWCFNLFISGSIISAILKALFLLAHYHIYPMPFLEARKSIIARQSCRLLIQQTLPSQGESLSVGTELVSLFPIRFKISI